MSSLMEKNAERFTKPTEGSSPAFPMPFRTKDENLAYAHGLWLDELKARKAAQDVYRAYQSLIDKVAVLEKERLSIEKYYTPIKHCETVRRIPVQQVQPKSREEIFKSWENLSEDQLEKMIASLEAL